MYNPITRGLRVQDQPWIHNKSACSCGVCTQEARQSIIKKSHINPRPSGSSLSGEKRSACVDEMEDEREVEISFKGYEGAWVRGASGWKTTTETEESHGHSSLVRKRRGDPFNERNRFGVSITGSRPTRHIHILGFIYVHPGRLSRGDSPARGHYGLILLLYMHLPLPQLSSTWLRQAFPPTLKNCCHHFKEDAKTGLRGLRGVWDVRPPNEGTEPSPSSRQWGALAGFQFCLGRCHLLHSWSYLVGAVIGDHRTNPWWLASPSGDPWLRWCTPQLLHSRSRC